MEKELEVQQAVHELFRRGDLDFILHDTQLEMKHLLLASDSDEVLIFCSRQLGKSFFIVVLALEFAIKNPNTIVRIFAHTVEQVRDIVNDNLRVIEQLAPPGLITRKKSDKRWQVASSEIRIGPLAAAHVDSNRGGNASLIILEEGGFTPSDEYRDALGSVINPQLLRSGGRLIHVTTPSKDMQHYIHTVVLPKCEASRSVARYTVYDNPQLTEEKIAKARERCTTEEEWEREYLAKIVKDQLTTVIPEFEEELHVSELTPPSHAYWQTSLDFGGTMDPHGLLLTYYDFERAKLCVYDERFLQKNTATTAIIAAALDMEKPAKWMNGRPRRVSDCPGQIVIDLRNEGFSVRTPEKTKGSWEAGINAVRLAFQRGEIEIDPRCKNLILTLKYGQYTKNRKDFQRTEQLGHLDLLAALIYAHRHQVKLNPFPPHLGKSRETHYLADEPRSNHLSIDDFLPDYI